jgi:hypothetical protein
VKLKNVAFGIVSAEFEGLVQAIMFSIYHEYEGYHKKQLKLVKSDERKGSGSFPSFLYAALILWQHQNKAMPVNLEGYCAHPPH